METHTVEEKREYYAGLRARWQSIKAAVTAGQLDEIKAVIAEHGLNVSPYSYAFTAAAMNAAGYEGIPYLDCKTFMGWKERGFQVRKGERSRIAGITWITATRKNATEDERLDGNEYVMPREYHLFHRSQVDAIV